MKANVDEDLVDKSESSNSKPSENGDQNDGEDPEEGNYIFEN